MQKIKLPVILAASMAALLLLIGLSSSAQQQNQSVNPDPVNHPNAVLINGIWRDNTHYFNPKTRVWVKISGSGSLYTTASGSFSSVLPKTDGFNITNFLQTMFRMTSNYDQFAIGDNIKVTHVDYSNKTGKVIDKITGENGDNYLITNIPFNLVSTNLSVLPGGIYINNKSGTIFK
jgi:hypothetical protein